MALLSRGHQLRRNLQAAVAPEQAGLLSHLVLGAGPPIPDDLVEAHRGTGLTHLLAVSGQNVAYVLALLRPVLERLPLRGRWGLTMLALLVFASMTRFEAVMFSSSTVSSTRFQRTRSKPPPMPPSSPATSVS